MKWEFETTEDWTTVQEVELVYKPTIVPSQRPQIHSPRESYDLLKQLWDKNTIELREQFVVLLLNAAGRVMGIFKAFSGGVNATLADPRIIFAAALKSMATGLILAHNHPSGSLVPSQADKLLTRNLARGGKVLGIRICDHLILSSERYFSFREEGLLK